MSSTEGGFKAIRMPRSPAGRPTPRTREEAGSSGLFRPSLPRLGAGHQRERQRSAASVPAQRHRLDARYARATALLCPPEQPPAPQRPRPPKRLRGLPYAGIALAASSPLRYTPGAGAEDRALLGSNPSAASVQGQGQRGISTASPSPLSCLWRKAENPRGPGTASPERQKVNRRPAGS